VCPVGAITVKNNIAHIDQALCTGCGACAAKCPAHVIIKLGDGKGQGREAS
jgi:ferredoxin